MYEGKKFRAELGNKVRRSVNRKHFRVTEDEGERHME